MNLTARPGRNNTYVRYGAWLLLALVIVIAWRRFPLSSEVVGDEVGYTSEVDYLAHYGAWHALSQGTSFLYTCLVFIFSKIFSASYLVTARVLSVAGFVCSCFVLRRIFSRFSDLGEAGQYFGVVVFGTLSMMWLWKGLPDMVSLAFLLMAVYLVTGARNERFYVYAGIFVFFSFAVKPVAIFAMPGLLLYTLLKRSGNLRGGLVSAALFLTAFGALFILYHIPGYQAYHRLMLEDKNHTYEGARRVEYPISWNEKNVYFELYNVHHRENKWHVSFDEVDSFKKQHPEINLKIGYGEYVRTHTGAMVGKVAGKIFLDLPSHIQHGFFFAKWTTINHLVKNMAIIRWVTFLLILIVFVIMRSFIRQNILLLVTPLVYYVAISLYTIPQLEDNWLLFCIPFLALPVVRFLTGKVNIYLLLALQCIYILI